MIPSDVASFALGGVNYKDFCWFIVDYLESGSTGVEELMNWWNE